MSLAGSAVEAALQAVGRGLDAAGDHRLLYCKGAGRLVALDEARARDLPIGGGGVLCGVPPDVEVEVYRGSPERSRPVSPGAADDEPFVCSYQKMAEHFNRKASLLEIVPLGSFNSLFSFTGSWKNDAAAMKSLAIDGYSVPLYRVKITSDELFLHESVKRAIPYSWDPSALASFIENYGTHIITSVIVGGKDEVYIKQHSSSQLSELEFKNYVREIGDERFSDGESKSSVSPINYNEKDMTVIFRRRGGCDLVQSFIDWIKTVPSAPDVIGMTFLPIVSLVDDIPGKKHLARAIDLYLTWYYRLYYDSKVPLQLCFYLY